MQRHKMEIKFDSILKQAMPLILFSYEKYRKPLLEKVGELYESFYANATDVFDELFSQLSDMIANREMFDSNKERLIESFINRDKTYEERLSDHDNELRKLTKQISLLKRPIKRISKKKSTQILSNPKCPNCGRILNKHGETNDGRRQYCCGKKGGCGKAFTTDKDGELQKGTI